MNRTLMPADNYIVINKSIITEEDKKILNMLYLPIIGPLPIMDIKGSGNIDITVKGNRKRPHITPFFIK